MYSGFNAQHIPTHTHTRTHLEERTAAGGTVMVRPTAAIVCIQANTHKRTNTRIHTHTHAHIEGYWHPLSGS